MQTVTVDIINNKALKLLQDLELLQLIKLHKGQVYSLRKKNKIAEDLKVAVREVNLAKQGKIKLKSAEALLDEL